MSSSIYFSEKEGEESEEANIDNENDEDEDGESREKKDAGQQGPWKSGGGPAPTAPAGILYYIVAFSGTFLISSQILNYIVIRI